MHTKSFIKIHDTSFFCIVYQPSGVKINKNDVKIHKNSDDFSQKQQQKTNDDNLHPKMRVYKIEKLSLL